MLTRTYKTATELEIPQKLFDALLKVRDILESGKLVHHPISFPTIPNGFNMLDWKTRDECNTVACIGGWAEMFAGEKFNSDRFTEGFYRLCYPKSLPGDRYNYNYDKITTAQAARAITNYLTTGDSKWQEVRR